VTRRELLVGAAGAAGAAALARAVPGLAQTTAQRPPPSAPAAPLMLKGVSLSGEVNQYDDTLGVRSYLLGGERPTDVVILWLLWPYIQPTAPTPFTLAGSFAALSDPGGPGAGAIQALDNQIAQANKDGRRVGLTIYQAFPDWTHPSVGALDPSLDPDNGGAGYPGQEGVANSGRVPDNTGEDGPWAWLVAWCCARWANTGGVATPGAGLDGVAVGNPAGAHLDWLAPMNEPNLTWWPQRSDAYPDGTIVSFTAELMRTAAAVAARYRNGSPQGPALLLPNTADVVDDGDSHGTPWHEFTIGLLDQLDGWQPQTPVGWAQHNYADVKYGPVSDDSEPAHGRWRAQETIALLDDAGWHDPAVWLTEGGYQFSVRRGTAPGAWVVNPTATADRASHDVYAEQVARLSDNWAAMSRLPVRLWTQYIVNDEDVYFQSGLRRAEPAAAGGFQVSDAPYPAYRLWPRLGA
jgi:hypothetical protein